jgi:hypothetical protein
VKAECNDSADCDDERRRFRSVGPLQSSAEALERQVEGALIRRRAKPTDLEHYIYLIDLLDRNEALSFWTARFLPILYEPTVSAGLSSATSTAIRAAVCTQARQRVSARCLSECHGPSGRQSQATADPLTRLVGLGDHIKHSARSQGLG